MNLVIKDEIAYEVMNVLSARAKYFEKMIESSLEVEDEIIGEWQYMADEYWAFVRQFSTRGLK